jgi:hypothetical protein
MWEWEKMVLKRELPKSIRMHAQGLNYGIGVCELEDHVGKMDKTQTSQQSLGL